MNHRRPALSLTHIAATLALVLCAPVAFPAPAYAELASRGYCGEQLTYTLEGEEGNLHLEVEGEGDMTSYTWLQRASEITSVTLPEGLTSICDNAFYRCTALHAIDIPEGVTRVGANTFFGCYSLTDVSLPSTLNEVGRYAFANTGVSYLFFKGSDAGTPLSITGFGYGNICLREVGFGEGHVDIPLNALSPGSVNLAAVSVPKSAARVTSDMLDTLTSISKVYYAGSADQWARVIKTRITYNPLYRAEVEYEADNTVRHSPNTTFAVAAGGGTISPVGCVDASLATKYTLRANSGYELDYVRVDGVVRSADASLEVGGDGHDHAIYAHFVKATQADGPATPASPQTPSGADTPASPQAPEDDPSKLPNPNQSGHQGNPGANTQDPSEAGESDPSQTHSGNPSAPPAKSDDVRIPDDAPPTPGWHEVEGTWEYLQEETLSPLTGWQDINGERYFFTPEGHMVTGWQWIEGKWYYFAASGAMQTGWIFDGTWYFLSNTGVMQEGWLYRDGDWYYLTPGGAIAIGWLWDDGWYYFNQSGAMRLGWLCKNGQWFYLNPGGKMATGWTLINGEWYYFKANGEMLSDAWLWQDAWYYFGPGGNWIP